MMAGTRTGSFTIELDEANNKATLITVLNGRANRPIELTDDEMWDLIGTFTPIVNRVVEASQVRDAG